MNRKNTGLSRREFLKLSGIILSLNTLTISEPEAALGTDLKPVPTIYPYRDWEDLYRKVWRWDKVVRGTHASTNCRANCAWDLFIKDGIIWKEEQSCNYPGPEAPNLVDFNPTGCQKGAMASQLTYAPYRIKYPLKRIGNRGEGKWKRISWDEALEEIADKIIDVIKEHGPETVIMDPAASMIFGIGPAGTARYRFFDLLASPCFDFLTDMSDLNYGAILTYGHAHVDGTMDDCLNSDFILVWTMNPTYTHIPFMHFIHEARYNGATVACIAPDYSASSVHADLWVPVAPGTDAALALGMAYVIVEEKLYDTAHIKEQTDLPFLVRDDNGKFLREKDMEEGGSEEIFYFWDIKTHKPYKAPGTKGSKMKTIVLNDLDPALEGSFEVNFPEGKKVRVRPVFERLKEVLSLYKPEVASKLTVGVGPEVIRKLGRDLAKAGSAMIFSSWGSNKNYHSDLINRAKALLLALCGHIGKPGSGLRATAAWWPFESAKFFFPTSLGKGRQNLVSSTTLFYKYHCGLNDVLGKDEWSDKEHLKKTMEEYIEESLNRGWMRLFPSKDKVPKIWVECGGNILRRLRGYHLTLERLWPKLDLVVTIDFRPNNTVLYSDIVLPAATQYEKADMKYLLSFSPYFCYQDKAVEPLYESKDEWEIFALLAKKIEEKAKEKGFTKFWDYRYQEEIDLTTLYQQFTYDGMFSPKVDSDQFMQYFLDRSDITAGVKVADIKKEGIFKVRNSGPEVWPSGIPFVGPFYPLGFTSPLEEGKALTPCLYYTKGKRPWPTLTGRQQFYIDHDWYLEFKEELPIHKEPPKVGGNYPFILSGGHTRWSIHNVWRDHPYMLRLQRGVPVMYMSIKDAERKGIKDHDLVKVYNDVGSFIIHVKLSPSVRPGSVIVYHAWDPNQHVGKRNQQAVLPGAMKAVHLVGNYGQLFLDFFHAAPAVTVRETRVEIELIA